MHEGVNRCLTQKEKLTQRHLLEMFGTEPLQYIDLEGDRIGQIRRCIADNYELRVIYRM